MDNLQLIQSLAVVVIPVLTPVLVDLLRRVAGSIPTNLLPIVAPVVGMLLSVVGQVFGVPGLDGTTLATGAALGAAGTGVREIVNQNVTGKKKAG